jgi:hypothetical protein
MTENAPGPARGSRGLALLLVASLILVIVGVVRCSIDMTREAPGTGETPRGAP